MNPIMKKIIIISFQMTSLLNSTSLVFAFIITPSTTIIPSNLECKNKIEDIDLLAKESFFCFRMKKHQEKEMNTCLVECKRIDDKPLGYGLSGWVLDNDDSGKRRAFAFAQNADPILKTYRKFNFNLYNNRDIYAHMYL